MKIGVRTLLWRREKIAKKLLAHYAGLKRDLAPEGIDLELVAIYSEDLPAREESGWTYLVHPNRPLSRKCAYGVAAFSGTDVDAVFNIGCDDFIGIESFRILSAELSAGIDFIAWLDAYLAHADHGMLYWPGYPEVNPYGGYRRGEPLGAGKCYSRRLLEALEWDPWDGSSDDDLDSPPWLRVQAEVPPEKIRVLPMSVLGPIVDVKDAESLSPWETRADYNEPVSRPKADRILAEVGLGGLLCP